MSSPHTSTKTIHEHLAENPNVDSSDLFERFWAILSGIRDQLTERFAVERHPACAGRESYQTDDGKFEGSLNTYHGPELEWLVHSWIGNRKNSILDMNINVWLGPHVDAPHLVIVFGTIPKIFHYSDYIPRRDLMHHVDYVKRYYEPAQADYLALRGDPAFEWSVSHGTYMRSVLSPIASSYTAERSDANVDTLERYVGQFVARWLDLVDHAPVVPPTERAALVARDHYIREMIYRQDPMNELARKFLGDELTQTLVDIRYGKEQIATARANGVS